MTKFGQVRAYDGETGMATIVYARPEACEKCGACHTKVQEGSITLRADCAPGDWVRVELPDGLFLRATTLAYLAPLVTFLAGLGLGWLAGGGAESGAMIGALIGLAVGLLAVWLADHAVRRNPAWTPRVTAVYGEKPDMDDIGCGGAGGH